MNNYETRKNKGCKQNKPNTKRKDLPLLDNPPVTPSQLQISLIHRRKVTPRDRHLPGVHRQRRQKQRFIQAPNPQ
ncbi:hypothetical protein, partial [Pseudomonas sp. DP16D-R1]|uniref:hypothetical protein n=1 Tax=Pseudomonas sp. DP16D-R1 TaxID=2075551 RepID=UPI001C47A570